MPEALVESSKSIDVLQALPSRRTPWVVPVLILLAALATFIPFLGVSGIIDPSDGFFSESAREMFESGDYITPRLNYEAYNNKPILTNWLICASYSMLGVSEFSSRLPSALCAITLCVVLFFFARKFLSQRAAVLSSLVLMSSILFSCIARVSLTDMPLTLFTNLTLFALFIGVEQRNKRFLMLGYIALGLSFLTKGPIALLIVGGSFLLYFAATSKKLSIKNIIGRFSELGIWKALAITALINLPWFIAVAVATKGAFINDFFFTENVMRAMGKLPMNHKESFWFYGPILAIGFFPWTIFLLAGIPAIRKWWQRRIESTSRIRCLVFCSAVATTVFCGFSALTGKLPTYIVPMVPAMAVLVGAFLDSFARVKSRALLFWTAPVLLAGGIATLIAPEMIWHVKAANKLIITLLGSAAIISFASFLLLVAIKRQRMAIWQMALSWTAIAVVMVPYFFLFFFNRYERGFAELLREAKSMNLPVMEVIQYSPSAPFYLRKHVPSIQNYFDLAYLLSLTPGEQLMICNEKYERMPFHAPNHRLVSRHQRYVMYAVSDPNKSMLKRYIANRNQSIENFKQDPNAADPKNMPIVPTHSIFLSDKDEAQ